MHPLLKAEIKNEKTVEFNDFLYFLILLDINHLLTTQLKHDKTKNVEISILAIFLSIINLYKPLS